MRESSRQRLHLWSDHLRRAAGSVWIRILVTVALLGLVAWKVDWTTAANRIAEGSWAWFATAVGTLFAAQVIAAVRWRVLLRGAGLDRPQLMVVRAYLIGVFANNFLPTAFGGDFARAWLLARPGPPLVRALLSVVVDRFIAFWCLVVLAWLALPTNPEAVPDSLVTALLGVTAAGLAASALTIAFALRGGRRLAKKLPERILGWARETRETLRLYSDKPKLLGAATVLGLAFQFLTILAMWMVAKAIDVQIAFSLLAVALPLVLAITLVPISIAGFGVREGGMVLLLGAAGYSATEATLLSLVGVAALMVSSLPGAAAMVVGHMFPSRDELEAAERAMRRDGQGPLTGRALPDSTSARARVGKGP
jgi:glycosyltransferase 2 family protein